MFMKNASSGFIDIVLSPFTGYLAPQTEESFFFDLNDRRSVTPKFSSEKFCLMIFIIALSFIALISPILCFGSLFVEVRLEGLWYFWLITIFEIGYSCRLIIRKNWKKAA